MNVKGRLGSGWRVFVAQDAVEITRICQTLHLIGKNIIYRLQLFSHFGIVLFPNEKIDVTQMPKTRIVINRIEQRDALQQNDWGIVCLAGEIL